MKQKIFFAFLILFCFYYGNAQTKVGEVSWQTSLPSGEFSDFIKKVNIVGVNFQGRWYLKNKRTSVGGSLSYFYFQDKKGKQTVQGPEGGTFTGDIINFTNIYGVQAVIQQDLKPNNQKTVPFIRIGLGGAYQDQRTYTGVYELQNEGFQFMGNVDAGLRIGDGVKSILLAASWHYLPASSEMVNTSFFGIKVGFTYFKF